MRQITKAFCLPALLLYLALSIWPAQDNKTLKPLSLRECIVQALANNLALSVEAFNPGIQSAAVSLTKEPFLPQLTADYSKQNQTSLGVWGLQGTSYPYTQNENSFTLSQKFATGTTALLNLFNWSSTTGQKYVEINPQYYTYVQLQLTQPLLKGFGPKVNMAPTYQAERQKEIATVMLKAKVLQTIYDVEQTYWTLYYDLENLKVQESSLEQSRELLKRAKEGERVGNQSAIDVLNAETDVASWEDALVSARLQVDNDEATLRKVLNLPPAALNSTERLILSDKPATERIDITYDQALAAALVHRPEIVQAEKQIAISASQVSYARNQLLPQFDLTLRGWSPGQSGVKFIFQDDNPLTGIIIGKIVGSRWDAFKQALRGTYKSWMADLSLTIPMADIFSRAALTQAKLVQGQNLATLEAQKQSVAFDVSEILKQVRNAELRIQSSAVYRALQEKQLASEMQRYQLGLLGGSQWLFEYQRRLAAAKASEVRALIDYRIAAARLEQVMGTTLERKGLKFRDYVF
jgi:outer membrane protein